MPNLAGGVLLGSRKPTFWIAPPFVTNAAQEAIELMASAGRPGAGWQRDTLHLWCGKRADGTWAAFRCFVWVGRQNGKGWLLEARELAGLFLWGERRIVHTAHRAKTVEDHFRRVLEVVDGSYDLSRRVRKVNGRDSASLTHGIKSIELMSGSVLEFRVRSGGGAGRGESGEVLVLDEALDLKQGDLDAQVPTMLAMPDAQLIYASTPPETAEAHIMDVKEQAEGGEPRTAGASWENPPGTDVDDEEARARVNPEYGRRNKPERFADIRGTLGEAGFARECLMIWPKRIRAKGDRIDPARWKALGDKDSRRVGDMTVAVDIAPERDWAAIGVYGLRADGLGHLRLVDYRPGVKWIAARVRELQKLNPIGWAMGRGTAASLEPVLQKLGIVRPEKTPTVDDPPPRGSLWVLNATDMAAACAQIIDATNEGAFRQVPAPALNDAVGIARTQVRGDSIAWTRKGTTGDVTPVVVVTLARWLHESWLPLLSEEDYDLAQSIY